MCLTNSSSIQPEWCSRVGEGSVPHQGGEGRNDKRAFKNESGRQAKNGGGADDSGVKKEAPFLGSGVPRSRETENR